jgi:heat shock protein HslJ
MNKKRRLLTLLCATILAACSPSMEREIELDGTRWKLQNMKDHELLGSTSITLEFGGSEIRGSAGCNSYGAEYTVQARNGIAIRSIERTLEACIEPEGVMQQEEQYLRILCDVTSYQAEGEGLAFWDEQGRILLQYERMP